MSQDDKLREIAQKLAKEIELANHVSLSEVQVTKIVSALEAHGKAEFDKGYEKGMGEKYAKHSPEAALGNMVCEFREKLDHLWEAQFRKIDQITAPSLDILPTRGDLYTFLEGRMKTDNVDVLNLSHFCALLTSWLRDYAMAKLKGEG